MEFEPVSTVVRLVVVLGVAVIATAVEILFIFYVSLYAVHCLSFFLQLSSLEHPSSSKGAFGWKRIMARTALEIDTPEVRLLGINPFKQIKRWNLLVLGILYKAKIVLTNVILKFILHKIFGRAIFGNILFFSHLSSLIFCFLGIPVIFIAFPVEIFWNSIVILYVIKEGRLRLFGYVLANAITDEVSKTGYLEKLSLDARYGCLMSIGNSVVFAQNYHPNMVVLLLRFIDLLNIDHNQSYAFDEWKIFLETLDKVSEEERNFLLGNQFYLFF